MPLDIPQPVSLDAEVGVFCSTFDQAGTRCITGVVNKTIKVCPKIAGIYRTVARICTIHADVPFSVVYGV